MKKNLPLYLYSTIIIGEGALLALSQDITLETVKFILGIGLITGSILAFFTAFSRQRRQVQFAYHEIHALTMLVYGTFILFFCKNLENLTNVTAFLLLFYAFKEIIFCNWLFNLGKKSILSNSCYTIVFSNTHRPRDNYLFLLSRFIFGRNNKGIRRTLHNHRHKRFTLCSHY